MDLISAKHRETVMKDEAEAKMIRECDVDRYSEDELETSVRCVGVSSV